MIRTDSMYLIDERDRMLKRWVWRTALLPIPLSDELRKLPLLKTQVEPKQRRSEMIDKRLQWTSE